jgi:betaine-aldehyde dehydrogenase
MKAHLLESRRSPVVDVASAITADRPGPKRKKATVEERTPLGAVVVPLAGKDRAGVSAREAILGVPLEVARALDQVPTKLFIDGRWTRASGHTTQSLKNPATEVEFARLPLASAADALKAVDAARRAFDAGTWSGRSGAERAEVLEKLAAKLREQRESIAKVEVLNNGKTIGDALCDVDDTAYCFEYFAKAARALDEKQGASRESSFTGLTLRDFRQPRGVVAAIVPWNYPLLMTAWKLAPALAAGCTVVLKPSEVTPLSALMLGKIAEEIGLPPGVLNIVPGLGKTVGNALVKSPKVDFVGFTGSTKVGLEIESQIIREAKEKHHRKAYHLELGGKSPAVVFDDVDLEKSDALDWILFGVFGNQGQVCSATSRLLVDEKIAPRLIPKLVERAKALKIGGGMEEGTQVGPLVSKAQYERVLALIESGKKEGATLLCGGRRADMPRGYFVEPTIFADVTPDMRIWNEEIFGPVLSIRTFKDEAEAIRLANDTEYGLAGAVFTRDEARLDRVAKAIDAGVVWENCSQPVTADGPEWRGMKMSGGGGGAELGEAGLELYLQKKTLPRWSGEFAWGRPA